MNRVVDLEGNEPDIIGAYEPLSIEAFKRHQAAVQAAHQRQTLRLQGILHNWKTWGGPIPNTVWPLGDHIHNLETVMKDMVQTAQGIDDFLTLEPYESHFQPPPQPEA